MKTINILYFASLSEQLDCKQETFDLSNESVVKVADLRTALSKRGDSWESALQANTTLCAVNKTVANDSTPLHARDEVAFFPPVTGG